jgi:CHASE2 domain-containing sensor protein
MIFGQRLTRANTHLRSQNSWFWIRLIGIVTIGVSLGYVLEERPQTIAIRSYSYRALQRIAPSKARTKYTAIVAIGDEEYWKDPNLAHRAPINRKYLSKLLRALNEADPAVIGLDFDLSSPFPDEQIADDPGYTRETQDLVAAVRDISKDRPVILPLALGTNSSRAYVAEPSIYDRFNSHNELCFKNGRCAGYIALPFDLKVLPPELILANGDKVLPFCKALAVAFDDTFVPAGDYTEYLDQDAFQQWTFQASDILKNPKQYKMKLHSRIVLIGGFWHTRAYNRGDLVDLHATPAGPMSGALIHANYVESMLDSRTLSGLSTWFRLILEWILTFLLALSLQIPDVRRWGLALLFLCLASLGLAYCVFLVFGVFFEFVIPSCAIVMHYVVEKIVH